MPLIYSGVLDGLGHDRWGAAGLLYTDAALGVIGVAVFLVVAFAAQAIVSRRPARA